MDDEFWDDIDKMIDNGTTPFAEFAQVPFTVEAPNLIDTYEESAAAPPFPFPVEAPNLIDVNEKSATAPVVVRPLTIEKSMSSQVDMVKVAMRTLVDKVGPKITLPRFKKEAIRAWQRKYPNSIGRTNKFQTFVKENMKDVRSRNPDMTHSEHMKLIGRMWKALPPTTA